MRGIIEQLSTIRIGKAEAFVPKADLRYDEYMAIKNEFSPYSFKASLKSASVVAISHFALIGAGRILRKLKRL